MNTVLGIQMASSDIASTIVVSGIALTVVIISVTKMLIAHQRAMGRIVRGQVVEDSAFLDKIVALREQVVRIERKLDSLSKGSGVSKDMDQEVSARLGERL